MSHAPSGRNTGAACADAAPAHDARSWRLVFFRRLHPLHSMRSIPFCAALAALAALASWPCVLQAVPPAAASAAEKSDAPPQSATEALGFKSAVFADASQVQNPTALAFDPAGNMLVTETHRWLDGIEDNRAHTYWIMDELAAHTLEGRAKLYEKYADHFPADYFTNRAEAMKWLADTDGDGKADVAKTFAGGFNDALDGPAIGVLSKDRHTSYLACIPHLWQLTDQDGDGVAEAKTPLLTGFGIRNSLSGHDLHGLVWGPDGKLYFSMGDRGFSVKSKEGAVLEDVDSGAVFRCNPDGTELEIFYHGLRNPQELAFNDLGDLFTVDNNCDQGDAARVCWLVEGGDSGWHIGHQALTTYKPYLKDGGFAQRPHWLSEGLWEKAHAGQPRWIIPPVDHLTDGPSGLVFTSGLSLPERYAGSFLVCDYKGASNQCRLWSFKTTPTADGYAMADAHLFQNGIACVDVDEGPDGRFYVVDFGGGWTKTDAGAVYALWWPEGAKRAAVAETKALLTGEDFIAKPPATLLALLDHPDRRVRQRAQFALAERGTEMAPALAERAAQKNLHGLWALRQMKALEPLRALLSHDDAEIRAQAARCLGDLRDAPSAARLQALLGAETLRERLFAAVALGRLKAAGAVGDVVSMIDTRGVEGGFQRHAGVMALAGCADEKMLAGLARHDSAAVRLSAALALRKQRSPLVVEFLRDGDPSIAGEAVRAINDLPLAAAWPALANEARRFFGQAPPALYQNEAHFRRLLHANQAVGTPEAAANLAQLAAHPALPETFRILALQTLEFFAEPPPIDPTTGLWRPFKTREKAPVKEAIAPLLAPVLGQAKGLATGAALKVAGVYGLPVGESNLLAWAGDEKQPLGLRLAAVKMLGKEVRPLLDSATPEVRAAAARRWAAVQPQDMETIFRILLAHGATPDWRAACELMASSTHPAAVEALTAQLDEFIKGYIPASAQLDLLEAAAARAEPLIKEKLAAAEAVLASQQRSLFDLTLEGGDPARGREVFENQGTCLKCHRITSVGGRAGPALDKLSERLKPEDMLRSLTHPNDPVVEGYGVVILTLDDDSMLTGTPLAETETELSMRAPSGSIEKIAKSRIKERTPPVSPMPPLGLTLAKKDLRDLMAYLRSL